jgi:DNA-binding CsgD family transcriptional regulator/pimeloyl-ACP methyl ester carboxylesterase
MDAPPLQYVTTPDGCKIAYCIAGEGAPLVYLPHPFSSIDLSWRTRSQFRVLFERLASHCRLITYDSRGLGSSTRGLAQTHRSEDFEVDLEAVVDRVVPGRFAIVAQNNFGRVAMNYAACNPGRVMALALWNADLGDVAQDQSYKPSQMESLAASDWELFLETIVRSTWLPEDPATAKRFLRESITQADWMIRTRAWRDYTAIDALPKLTMPVLLMAYRKGFFQSTQDVSAYIASQIQRARLAVFDDIGGGMFSMEPQTPPAVALILDLLREVSQADEAIMSSSAQQRAKLSARELEVVRLIAAGKSNPQIANELVISLNTVQRHVSNILAKSGSANRTEAALYAREKGLA